MANYMLFYPAWKSYGWTITPTVDTVLNSFTVTLSYVAEQASYDMGDGTRATLKPYKGGRIRAGVWTSDSIYINSDRYTDTEDLPPKLSSNSIALKDSATIYTGYVADKEYRQQTFNFPSVRLLAGRQYYIGVFDANSKAGKVTQNGHLLVQYTMPRIDDALNLYDICNTASRFTPSRTADGSTRRYSNIVVGVQSTPKVSLSILSVSNDGDGSFANIRITSDIALNSSQKWAVYYREKGTVRWSKYYLGLAQNTDFSATVPFPDYREYEILAKLSSATTEGEIAQTNMEIADTRRPVISIDRIAYGTVRGDYFDIVPVISTNFADDVLLRVQYSFDDNDYIDWVGAYPSTIYGESIVQKKPYGNIYFRAVSPKGIYSYSVFSYYNSIVPKIYSSETANVGATSISVRTEINSSVNCVLALVCGSRTSVDSSPTSSTEQTIDNLIAGREYLTQVILQNKENGAQAIYKIGNITTNALAWYNVTPYIRTKTKSGTETYWADYTPYVYRGEKWQKIDLQVALSPNDI